MLTRKDFEAAAQILGCEPEVIQAVTAVEAPRGAFDSKGKLTILFEPHIFWKEIKKKFNYPLSDLQSLQKEYPGILSPTWNPALYGKYSEQWTKFQLAASILHGRFREQAYRSTSYGAFQILGQNAESIGYKSVYDFYVHQEISEAQQLNDFVKFIKVNGLDDELREKDWAGFARGYNGPQYHKNQYDKKLAQAYKKAKE